MSASTTIQDFQRLYLHDSMIRSFEVLPAEAQCRLQLDSAALLPRKGGDKFNPLARYTPALLVLEGVREITFDGRYQLNATLVDIEAVALEDGENVEFRFDLTGGHDPEAYLVKLRIVGKCFSLSAG